MTIPNIDGKEADARISDEELRATLEWYANQVEGCRKLGSIGDPSRHALDADGGKRARKALELLSARAQLASRQVSGVTVGSDDDVESIAHALSIAGMATPCRDYQGSVYFAPNDQYPDAEFRDYGLARAFRVICNNAKAILAALQPSPEPAQPLQQRVQPWMMACFGPEISADREERNHRFFEEATETVQAAGMTRSEAHQLVDYTFDRPAGELPQEVGGVMITLAALCLAQGIDMHTCGETELARIWTKVEQIREKQAAKPKHSPLPAHPAAVADKPEPVAWRYQGRFGNWQYWSAADPLYASYRERNPDAEPLYAAPLPDARSAGRVDAWHPAEEKPPQAGVYECWVTGVPPQSHPLQAIRFTERGDWLTGWGPISHWRELTRPPAKEAGQ